jgi:tRNA A-37 threonylcarbamoyl transferase component Bud32
MFLGLHEVGIVHNNICPDNILVDAATGDLRIIDLALATEHVCPGPEACPELQELSWLVYRV